MRNEDIEFQIEMLAIQIRQQHISTIYSTLLSIEFSVMVTIMVLYTGLYFSLGNPFFSWLATLSVAFVAPIIITLFLYQRETKKLDKEFERLRKRYSKRRLDNG